MADRHYQVLVDDYDIDETEIHNPIGQSDISIVPVISGAGGGRGLGKILLGAALIGTALLLPGAAPTFGFSGFSAATGSGAMGAFSATLANIGLGLTLMGVTEMLFPLPKPQDFSNEEDPRISFSFSGVQNTSRAGTSHPIAYGEIVTGSVVISAGIDTNQVQA